MSEQTAAERKPIIEQIVQILKRLDESGQYYVLVAAQVTEMRAQDPQGKTA